MLDGKFFFHLFKIIYLYIVNRRCFIIVHNCIYFSQTTFVMLWTVGKCQRCNFRAEDDCFKDVPMPRHLGCVCLYISHGSQAERLRSKYMHLTCWPRETFTTAYNSMPRQKHPTGSLHVQLSRMHNAVKK